MSCTSDLILLMLLNRPFIVSLRVSPDSIAAPSLVINPRERATPEDDLVGVQ